MAPKLATRAASPRLTSPSRCRTASGASCRQASSRQIPIEFPSNLSAPCLIQPEVQLPRLGSSQVVCALGSPCTAISERHRPRCLADSTGDDWARGLLSYRDKGSPHEMIQYIQVPCNTISCSKPTTGTALSNDSVGPVESSSTTSYCSRFGHSRACTNAAVSRQNYRAIHQGQLLAW